MFTPRGRRRAKFGQRVKKADGSQGFIDAFWPGTLLVEMKSRGRDLAAAYQQALDYLPNLPTAHLPPSIGPWTAATARSPSAPSWRGSNSSSPATRS